MTETHGLIAGHPVPKDQPEVTSAIHREWCKRRAYYILNKGNLGHFGNAIGQLCADLMRHEDTRELIEKIKKIDSEEELRVFLEYL